LRDAAILHLDSDLAAPAATSAVATPSTMNKTNRLTGSSRAPSIRAPSNATTTTHAPIPEAMVPSQLLQIVESLAASTKDLSENVKNDRDKGDKRYNQVMNLIQGIGIATEENKLAWNERYDQLSQLIQDIGSVTKAQVIQLNGEWFD
jgi:hypothetical protein